MGSVVHSFPVRSSWTLIVFRSLWVILMVVISVLVTIGMIEHERWEVALFIAPFQIVAVFVVRNVLWLARGRELVMLVKDGLVVRRTGSFWMWDIHVDRHEFEGLSVDRCAPGFVHSLLGYGEDALYIHYLGRKVRVGAYLEKRVLIAAKDRIDEAVRRAWT